MEDNNPIEPHNSGRWTLIRDTAVLQVKLVVDGLRDFLLVPASLIAALASLMTAKDGKPGPQFYRLLAIGKRSEEWISLFGAYNHRPEEFTHEDPFSDMNIDELVVRVESYVVDEYKRGGMTTHAKGQIDKALNAIQRRRQKQEKDDTGP